MCLLAAPAACIRQTSEHALSGRCCLRYHLSRYASAARFAARAGLPPSLASALASGVLSTDEKWPLSGDFLQQMSGFESGNGLASYSRVKCRVSPRRVHFHLLVTAAQTSKRWDGSALHLAALTLPSREVDRSHASALALAPAGIVVVASVVQSPWVMS